MDFNFRSILIVTYGRSGSTLLQGMLNSIEGVLVRGENHNFIEGLYLAYNRLEKSKTHHANKPQTPQHPWYGASKINIDQFLENCQKTVKDILLSQYEPISEVHCYGFKEVRWLDLDDLEGYLDFLAKIFPNPLYIFLTRDIEEVLVSGWWINHEPDSLIKKISEFEQKVIRYSKSNKDRFYTIDYSDLIGKTEKLKNLFSIIGVKFSEMEIDGILLKPHSAGLKSLKSIKISRDPRIKYTMPREVKTYLADYLIDGLPKKIIPFKKFSFGGVVIPANNDVVINSIYIRCRAGKIEAEKGFNSPIFHKMYPDITGSSIGRFLLRNITLEKKEEAIIYFETNTGITMQIGRVKAEIHHNK